MVMRRLDRVGLAKPLRRPDGQMVAQGFAAREGILLYEGPGGRTRREFVPGEVLKATAPRLIGLPVTVEHPPEPVSPDNYKRYAVGTVLDAEYDEGEKAIVVTFSCNDREVLQAISRGKHDLSPGYEVPDDETPGANAYGGYDAIQHDRQYNHLALVDEGRGDAVYARLDSAGHALIPDQNGLPQPPSGVPMNPLLLEVAAFLGIQDPSNYGTDDRLVSALRRRVDSMHAEKSDVMSELEAANAAAEAAKKIVDDRKDDDGPERVDMNAYEDMKAKYDSMKAQYDEMSAMLDSLMGKMEADGMKPMADAYDVEVEDKDRADDIYRKIAAKMIPTFRADSREVPMDFVRGVVEGDWARRQAETGIRRDSATPRTREAVANELDRQAGVRAGEAAWRQAFGTGARPTPATHGFAPRRDSATDDLFRPGPAAVLETTYRNAQRRQIA